jgi:hypothetical protein
MTLFLKLAGEFDKEDALVKACLAIRSGTYKSSSVFDVPTSAFSKIPGKPFSYWISDNVRSKFQAFPPFERDDRLVRQGLASADDNRFLRLWWEPTSSASDWPPFTKGGAYSPFYYEQSLVVRWANSGAEMRAFDRAVIRSPELYMRPGLTWPLRAKRFSPQVMTGGCVFSARGYSAFPLAGREIVALAIMSSLAFDYLFKSALGRFGYPEFIVGVLQHLPWVEPNEENSHALATLARRAWSLKRRQDSVQETSHAFLLPAAMLARLGNYDSGAIESELITTQTEIDDIAFDLYGFNDEDRAAALGALSTIDVGSSDEINEIDDPENEDSAPAINQADALLSWAVGVAFGRFDWHLAIGEREAPPEPDPFDPLPAKSPGMLPDGVAPFHAHAGILVEDQGHPHDLPRLIEEVLARVQADLPNDVRRWLQRDFFPLHLKQYSKSRRKAPIYWPLSTTSSSYTLWLYYPSLTSQTLYTAVNDFVEPKLKQVSRDTATMRDKGSARSRDDEKTFEALQALELELIELRDTLLQIAPTYRPNHDDGVQITAAPLWQLFRHKPWQKILKDTWTKLEKGEYDWAHLAMAYWPNRVREKCKTDKSLAIAHDLEHLYVEPVLQPKPTRRLKKTGAVE